MRLYNRYRKAGMTIVPAFFVVWGCIVAQADSNESAFRFADATEASGISQFQHRLGHLDKRWIVDAMGSGVAVGDYDNDGDDDLYFVNGRPDFERADSKWSNRLYRNQDGKFTDVTAEAGVGDLGMGMCAVFGDVDNDGRLDLFVGNIGRNTLYRNQGDGTFVDITTSSGIEGDFYTASASFGDYDRDGDLDLFVGNYVAFDPKRYGDFGAMYYGVPVFKGPLAFDAQKDQLYENDGSGHFHDAAAKAGINVSRGRAMGSVFFDMDGDGWLDLYVTNDSTYNHILRNQGNGHFEDLSLISGGGFSDDGLGGASMGVSVGDYDNDGRFDVAITSYQNESDMLFHNDGDGLFTETTAEMGLFGYSLRRVTWGSGFGDFDSDGWLDFYTVNGHVYPQADRLFQSKEQAKYHGFPYGQGISLYHRNGERYEILSALAIPSALTKIGGRGAAMLDYDNDGDLDIAINCIDSQPVLLENRSPQGNWLKVKLLGTSAQIYGTKVVVRCGDRSWTRMVDGGSGYLSQNTSLLHFGLGGFDRVDELIVYWPHRKPQWMKDISSRQTVQIDPGVHGIDVDIGELVTPK